MNEREKGIAASVINAVASSCHQVSVDHGFWEGDDHNIGEKIALMHSELSEALEGLRAANPPDKHCPEFTSAEVELADVIIRIFDLCGRQGWKIGDALVAKYTVNQGREYKHGKEF